MPILHRRFVRTQEMLEEALQRATREEQGVIPVQLQTPAEKRKSAAEARRLERSIERSISRRRKVEDRLKKIVPRGEY